MHVGEGKHFYLLREFVYEKGGKKGMQRQGLSLVPSLLLCPNVMNSQTFKKLEMSTAREHFSTADDGKKGMGLGCSVVLRNAVIRLL